ncbi:hypothetical protein LH128_00190 [Sphingomonas sp. LH128]|uniref:hypothetical protein n=1 Tax=Sphingomonas sp. LH128 TaxID=473781 RepID=UPI00027CB151|nr:hypothetical protein [Sphingomonas sp. LH128]EJU15155.1 hypothetical protein LH128_00190 [Sphingomonas sp. LH128]
MMDDEKLALLDFVRASEVGEWKLVRHSHSNVQAARSCGLIARFGGEDEATAFVKARSIEAMLKSYHRLAAGEPA